ncbi:hypothetical protein HYT25_03480 [Candidatus Pacearchaeota archaeon]|nr:hypothetical protein [Candidatus Pacearchaeota archaeon]
MKKIKKETGISLIVIALMQIMIMLISISSESYAISQNNNFNNINIIENDFGKLINLGFDFLVGFLAIKQIASVSAQDDQIYCCEKRLDSYGGGLCTEVNNNTECDSSYRTNPSTCQPLLDGTGGTSFCRMGTCVFDNGLSCSDNSVQTFCEADGGEWIFDSSANVPECDRGACVFPDSAVFSTLRQCELEYLSRGLDTSDIDSRDDYDETQTILLSLALSSGENKGACVLSGGACRFETGAECENDGGTHFPGFLCTHPDLQGDENFGVNCFPTSTVSCLNGKDEIYFMDSCQQPGNIYNASMVKEPNEDFNMVDIDDGNDGDDDDYWAYVVSKTSSCELDLNDDNSLQTCGNCARTSSSVCSETTTGETHIQDGDFVCKDLRCEYADEVFNHGESFCVYTSAIGQQLINYKSYNGESDGNTSDVISTDAPGSEHWKLSCINGKIHPEPPDSFGRVQVCVPKIISQEITLPDGTNDTISFRTATLENNLASLCVSYNPLQEKVGDKMEDIQQSIDFCEQNPHCYWKEMFIDDNDDDKGNDDFKFKICVPRYPLGTSDYCPMATLSCPTVYVKGEDIEDVVLRSGLWDVYANEYCEKPIFAEKMNNLCVSFGDCGNYVNYIGEGTNDNIEIKRNKGDKSHNLNDNWPYEDGDDNWDFSNYIGFANETNFLPQAAVSGLTLGEETCPPGTPPDECAIDLGNVNVKIGGNLLTSNLKIANALGGIGALTFIGTKIFGDIALVQGVQNVILTIESRGSTQYFYYTQPTATTGPIIAPAAGAVVGAIIGARLGSFLAEQAGVVPGVANIYILSGAIAGGTAGYALVSGWIAGQWIAWGAYTGWGFVAAVAILIYLEWSGAGEIETRNIDFVCNPWQAPTGGDCERCNEDSLIPCTQYACENIGQLCKFVEDDTTTPFCISESSSDNVPPILTLGSYDDAAYEIDNAAENFSDLEIIIGERESDRRYPGPVVVSGESGNNVGCIQEDTEVILNLNTDEFAQCKFSFEANELSETINSNGEIEIGGNFVGNNEWKKAHVLTMQTPTLGSLDPSFNSEQQNTAAYIRCKDYYNNPNIIPQGLYKVKFCVEARPDIEPPIINSIEPATNSYLPFETTEKEIDIWLDERGSGSCRYSTSIGTSYENMLGNSDADNTRECTTIGLKTAKGILCNGMTLTGIVPGENKFYIRCSDDETPPNANQQDYEYKLFSTETQLSINSISLTTHNSFGDRDYNLDIIGTTETEVTGGGDDFNIDLKAITSGGSDGGKAICGYEFTDSSGFVFSDNFFSDITGTKTHTQNGLGLNSGNWNVLVSCEDNAGNEIEKSGTFNLSVDSQPPIVTRAFKEGNKLTLFTNEEAKCSYGTQLNYCSQGTVDSGVSITTGFAKEHSTSWIPGQTYYIKCKDLFDKENQGCARIIVPNFEVV